MEADTEVMMEELIRINAVPIDPLAPDYPFKPAVPGVPILKRYDKPPPPDFWTKFPKDRNIHKGSPFKIDTVKLRKWTMKSNPSTVTEHVMEGVINDLENGADLEV